MGREDGVEVSTMVHANGFSNRCFLVYSGEVRLRRNGRVQRCPPTGVLWVRSFGDRNSWRVRFGSGEWTLRRPDRTRVSWLVSVVTVGAPGLVAGRHHRHVPRPGDGSSDPETMRSRVSPDSTDLDLFAGKTGDTTTSTVTEVSFVATLVREYGRAIVGGNGTGKGTPEDAQCRIRRGSSTVENPFHSWVFGSGVAT